MNASTSGELQGQQRRVIRGSLALLLTVGLAFGGFAVISAGASHRAGAATPLPKALDSTVVYSMSATGVTGEGVTGQPGTIEINSFQWGVGRGVAASSGRGSGKATLTAFTITRQIDRASPQFFKSCVSGAHYKTVTLYIRKAGEAGAAPGPSLTLTFTNVLVSSVSWSGAAGGSPLESISMIPKTSLVQYSQGSPAG